MTAQYIRKVSSRDTIEGLKDLAEIMSKNKRDTFVKIEDTCPADEPPSWQPSDSPDYSETQNPAPASIRRLSTPNSRPSNEPPNEEQHSTTEEKIRAFLQSDEADDVKRYAAKQLGADVDVDSILEKVLGSLSDKKTHDTLKTSIDERLSKVLEMPEMMDFVERALGAEAGRDGQAGRLAARLLEGSVDPRTGGLDSAALEDTISKLKEIREGARDGLKKEGHQHRKLSGCDEIFAVIKDFIKV